MPIFSDHVTLADCLEGETPTIQLLGGTPRFISRLQTFGLVPGAQIRVLRHGSPIILLIGDTRLCLRRRDAGAIRVAQPEFDYQATAD